MVIFKPSLTLKGFKPYLFGVEAMKSFSQRTGLKPVKSVIQSDSIDSDLRNGLWNILYDYYWSISEMDVALFYHPKLQSLCKSIWMDFFKKPTDTIGTRYYWEVTYKILRVFFYKCKWNEIYDFIEFIANNYSDEERNKKFMMSCNEVLKKELSAYRFVGGFITQITSEQEIQEIEEAIKTTSSITPIQEHLTTALKYFSDRKTPDYRNSIKESISAVESLCNLINGKKSTLGKTIEILESKVKIHGALKEAFKNLYGWTSDAEGIRHGMMDDPNLDFEDAKFMLVSCSAFINYLIIKAQKAGVEKFR